ncbi:MAG: Uma2 family endonuclease [Spirulinaceae cyanobacterium SM2_1_0]|nr:Uma2 family endonuclease [Spirulinaceae cyanobacterium SM2_1_0]
MVRLDAQQPLQTAAVPPAGSVAVDTDASERIACPPPGLYSDEPPLETDFHRNQIDLLIRLLKYWWRDRSDFYISGNLTVYYSAEETKKRDFRGPDVFVVLDTEKRDRRSWVLWEEGGKYPNVVIELLSDSTAAVDKGKKKDVYATVWRLPEYYWFHPETMEFAGFRLGNGHYEAIAPDAEGRLVSEELGLALGIHERQLRWYTAAGELIPLPEVAAEERAEQERQRAERLEAFLRSQGIDPDHLPE